MRKNDLNDKGFIGVVIVLVVVIVVIVLGGMKLGFWNIPFAEKFMPKATISQSEAVVEITKDGFIPQTLQVKKSQQVKWVNKDFKQHWIASDPHPTHSGLSGLDSESGLETDESYSFMFEKTGTFTYHDHLNPLKIKGTIIVQ